MKKLLLTLFILITASVSYAQTVFTVTHDGKSYSFPLESKITVTDSALWVPDTVKQTVVKTDTVSVAVHDTTVVTRVDTTVVTRVDTLLKLDTIIKMDTIVRVDTLLQLDTIIKLDTLLKIDTMLVEKTLNLDSIPHYFYYAALQVFRQGSTEDVDTIYFKPMGDYTFIARDSLLKKGDEILLMYKGAANSRTWSTSCAMNHVADNKNPDYNLYETNRLGFGNRNKWKVTKDPNVTLANRYGKKTSEAVFILTGNTLNNARLIATGYGVEPTLTIRDTVGVSYKSKYKGVNFRYEYGNYQTGQAMTLVQDSVWAYTFNIDNVGGIYIQETGGDNYTSNTTLKASGTLTKDFNGTAWQSNMPHQFSGEVTIFYDERNHNYSILGFKDSTQVEALTDFTGTWYYQGTDLFSIVNDSTMRFASRLHLKEPAHPIAISGDTLTIFPVLSYDSVSPFNTHWIITGSYAESYDTTSTSNNGNIVHDFKVAQRNDYYEHLRPVKILLREHDCTLLTDWQILVFNITDPEQSWHSTWQTYVFDKGQTFYKVQ